MSNSTPTAYFWRVTPQAILKKYWGFDSFRPLQEDIIRAALDGCDTLALLPTGGGKSICFQVPSLCQEGICIVVSPLIALMKDQVQNLKKREIQAEAIYSGMHYRDIDRILDNCIHGAVKFLYLSPERLTGELARERIRQMNVNLLAVDEAHCISQWGYDFRPSYLQIAEIREILPKVPILALTATATDEVVEDIQEKLEFRKEGKVFSKSFSRENLAYVVLTEDDKRKKLREILTTVKGAGVVYVRNRKAAKQVAEFLRQQKINADFYHAGLSTELRSQKQEAWMSGKVRIMVSTNAFGMGIDKADVRSVVHLDLPESLEAYFQEAGRAGRDGKKAYAVLLYAPEDKAALERNHKTSFPPIEEIHRVYRALGSYFQLAVGAGAGLSLDFDIVEFCKNFKLDILTTFSCLKILEQEGWLVLTESVYLPSTFKVLVNREKLYDFQLKNRALDPIIKTLLRVTEGAFLDHAKINENAVARFLKITAAQLVQALHQLHKEGIIEYRPTKDQPQLYFLQDRVDAQNLTIDMKQYNFRKERHLLRIQKAVEYATRPVCRSQQLLKYFGEKNAPCGTCDVCLGRTKAELNADDFERYKLKISQLLKKERLSEAELLESFAPHRHARVLRALGYLLDEGLVVPEAGRLIWKD